MPAGQASGGGSAGRLKRHQRPTRPRLQKVTINSLTNYEPIAYKQDRGSKRRVLRRDVGHKGKAVREFGSDPNRNREIHRDPDM